MLERFEEFTYLMSKINKDIQKIKLEELKKYGLKGAQMEFIHYIGKNGSLSFKEICEYLHSDKAFVSRNLKLLEKAGFIKRELKQNNSIYSLTNSGLDVYKLNKKKAEEICHLIYIDEDKIDTFYKNLHDISRKLDSIGEKNYD